MFSPQAGRLPENHWRVPQWALAGHSPRAIEGARRIQGREYRLTEDARKRSKKSVKRSNNQHLRRNVQKKSSPFLSLDLMLRLSIARLNDEDFCSWFSFFKLCRGKDSETVPSTLERTRKEG
jgi:hypothetical protein